MSWLGDLLVRLKVETADFQGDLGKAATVAEKELKRVEDAWKKVGDIAAAVGVGLSAVGFTEMIKGSLDAQEALQNLGAKAGLTGEQFSSLTTAARLSHTSFDDVASMSARLSKALIESTDSTTKSAAVLGALGITGKDVARLLADPANAVFELAKKINELPEGGTKAAAQLILLGKSGGTTSAFMNQLAGQTELVTTRTQEQINAAKEFNDKLTMLSLSSENLKASIANQLLPSMDSFVKVLLEGSTQAGSLQSAANRLASNKEIEQWADSVAMGMAFAIDAVKTLVPTLDLAVSGFTVLIAKADAATRINPLSGLARWAAGDKPLQDYKTSLGAIALAQEDFSNKLGKYLNMEVDGTRKAMTAMIASRKQAQAYELAYGKGGPASAVGGSGDPAAAKKVQDALAARAGAAGAAALNTAMQAQLRARSQIIVKEENALASAREGILAEFHGQGLISETDYYDRLRGIISDRSSVELAELAKDIAAQEQLLARAATPAAKVEAETNLMKLIARRGEIEQATGLAKIKTSIDEDKAAQAYLDTLSGINVALLQQQGYTVAAAEAQLATQNRLLKQKVSANSGENSLPMQQIKATEALTVAKARLQEIDLASSQIQQRLANQESDINSARASWQVTDLQQMALQSQAREKTVAQLLNIYNAQLEVVQTLSGPEAQAALLAAQTFKSRIDALAASADVLGNSLKTTFSDSITKFLDAAIGKTATFHDAFVAMIKDIATQMLHISNQQIAQSLMTSDIGGTVVSGAKSLLGSGSSFSSFVSGFFADGGNPTPNTWNIVGEKGPEPVWFGAGGGTVLPNSSLNDAGGSASSVSNIITDASRQVVNGAKSVSIDASRTTMQPMILNANFTIHAVDARGVHQLLADPSTQRLIRGIVERGYAANGVMSGMAPG